MDSIIQNFNNDSKKLLKELFSSKNYEAIIHLYFNVEKSREYITRYSGLYCDRYLIETLSLTDYQTIANNAAKTGDLDLVKYCNEKGADNYKDIVINCAKKGHLNIIEYIDNLGLINCYEDIASYAAQSGYIEIVQYTVKLGAKNYEIIAENAAQYGHFDIVKYAL